MPGSIGHPASLLLPFVRSPSVILDKKTGSPINNVEDESRVLSFYAIHKRQRPWILACARMTEKSTRMTIPVMPGPIGHPASLSLPPHLSPFDKLRAGPLSHHKGKTGLEVTRANIALLCHAMILLCFAMIML